MDFEGRPGQLGYFWRLATTLLVALAASAFCTPALAQSTTEHCTSSSLELWCATLVVGNKSGESLYGYGGGATVAESDDFGSLSDSQFTFKGETWDIEGLVFSPGGGGSDPSLVLALSGNPDFNVVTAPVAGFALRIGTGDFALGNSAPPSEGFKWTNPGLDWSSKAGEEIAVKLIRSNQSIRVLPDRPDPTDGSAVSDVNDGIGFSGPGADKFYTHGENLEITLRFSEPVYIPDARLLIATGYCTDRGNRLRAKSGNRSDTLVFGCTITGGPYSRVFLDANRLIPGTGGGRGAGFGIARRRPPGDRRARPGGAGADNRRDREFAGGGRVTGGQLYF